MIRIPTLPVQAAVLLAALAALSGCVKKAPTQANPAYTPEGTFSPLARLAVYPDVPNTLLHYDDIVPIGEGLEDTLIGTMQIRQRGPGVNYLMLLDATEAGAFEALRRESGGGYFSYKDFLYNPSRKWIDGQAEVFMAVDDNPSGFSPATYMMRGVVGGEITAESPLTNAAVLSGSTVGDITFTAPTIVIDSLFTISWAPVAGAAGYWVQVYQFLEAFLDDQINSGFAAPLYIGKQRDYFLGYFPSTITSYKLGTSPPDVEIFTRRGTLRGQIYLVRISAMDADGRMIAYTYGDYGQIPGDTEYTLFPLGAVEVDVRSMSSPNAAREAPGETALAGTGGLHIVRRDQIRR